MQQLSATAQARENARIPDGKFGEQNLTDQGEVLSPETDTKGELLARATSRIPKPHHGTYKICQLEGGGWQLVCKYWQPVDSNQQYWDRNTSSRGTNWEERFEFDENGHYKMPGSDQYRHNSPQIAQNHLGPRWKDLLAA